MEEIFASEEINSPGSKFSFMVRAADVCCLNRKLNKNSVLRTKARSENLT